MRTHLGRASVRTTGRVSVENVTALVRGEVARAGFREGIVVVSVPHTTCGIVINEDETGLKEDIRRLAEGLLTPLSQERRFEHDRVDDNAQAHLTSLLLGHCVTLPLSAGDLLLGTWQSVFLVEMDGPRSRSLTIQVLGA